MNHSPASGIFVPVRGNPGCDLNKNIRKRREQYTAVPARGMACSHTAQPVSSVADFKRKTIKKEKSKKFFVKSLNFQPSRRCKDRETKQGSDFCRKRRYFVNAFHQYQKYLDDVKLLDDSERSVLLKQAVWRSLLKRRTDPYRAALAAQRRGGKKRL